MENKEVGGYTFLGAGDKVDCCQQFQCGEGGVQDITFRGSLVSMPD